MVAQKQKLYMISVVAEMLGIHPQTLRLYEREGFIKPQRSGGNTRLYSDKDVDRVEMILRLTLWRSLHPITGTRVLRFWLVTQASTSTSRNHAPTISVMAGS